MLDNKCLAVDFGLREKSAKGKSDSCVAILMSTFNGEKYIAEQLDSILNQTHKNWVLHISDDGSVDQTIAILNKYSDIFPVGKFFFHTGPSLGFAQNFLTLVRSADVVADYYAFCDQDDIWLSDKIERALDFVGAEDQSRPLLYCSRTRLVDEGGSPFGFSTLFLREPGFGNALVQSLAGANTMLFNGTARELLRRVPSTAEVISHDWLVYMITSGCGGKVFYDSEPRIYYRQHENNLVGANAGLGEKLKRLFRLIGGDFRRWNNSNLTVLSFVDGQLIESSCRILSYFNAAREARGLKRVLLLRKSGVYRQGRLDNVALLVAALIGRV